MKRHGYHPARCLILLALCLFALGLLLCGCNGDGDQPPLFQDDFENPRTGWGEDERKDFERGYDKGEYFFELSKANWFVWAYPGETFGDVSVDVNAHLASGARDAHFGVLCRHVDLKNFYYFAVSADGYYAIFRSVDGDMEILTGNGDGMLPSPSIRTGTKSNHIRAVCEEEELSLYANGDLLATVDDDALQAGGVGLGAGSGSGGGARVQFDDFVVDEP